MRETLRACGTSPKADQPTSLSDMTALRLPGSQPRSITVTSPSLPKPFRYVDNPAFHSANAWKEIMTSPEISPMEKSPSRAQDSMDRVVRHPLLSKESTKALFLKMNFLKFLAAKEINASESGALSPKQLEVVSSLLAQASEVRDTLVLSNTRLALSTARTFIAPHITQEDLASAGFGILLKSVEFFDCAQSTAFSNYAITSLRREYVRMCASERAHTSGLSTNDDGFREPEDRRENPLLAHARQELIKTSVESALSKLPLRERTVIKGCVIDERPLRDVGDDIGVTGEGARVIKLRALSRLKTILDSDPTEEAL